MFNFRNAIHNATEKKKITKFIFKHPYLYFLSFLYIPKDFSESKQLFHTGKIAVVNV